MKALSLWQPWASLVVLGLKRWETRSWSTEYRGPLAIHAARALKRRECLRPYFSVPLSARGWEFETLPRGYLIGTVELVDVVRTETLIEPRGQLTEFELLAGNFAPGRFAWKLERPVLLDQPLIVRGRQGLFELPATILP